MKILFLIESMSVKAGGTALEIERLAGLLSQEKEMEITIACTELPEQIGKFKKDGVTIFQFKNPVFPGISWLRAVRKLKQLIHEHDIIFSTGIWGPIDGLALRLARKGNKPLYVRVCGMLEPYILARRPLMKKLALALYVRHNLNTATGVIVNSHSEANNIHKAGIAKEKIHIIPNGISIPVPSCTKTQAKTILGIDPQRPVLLYLGRIHPKKGLHFLLKAISLLPDKQKIFTLLVAGDYSDTNYQSEIENSIRDLKLEDFVNFSGLVTGKVKEDHFTAADCFILPSESEGLPNAVLEAMARGLPVILTSGCNIPEIATYNAGLVIDLSISNLVNALDWFISRDDSFGSKSANAVRLIKEKFTLEQSLHQYKTLITRACDKPFYSKPKYNVLFR